MLPGRVETAKDRAMRRASTIIAVSLVVASGQVTTLAATAKGKSLTSSQMTRTADTFRARLSSWRQSGRPKSEVPRLLRLVLSYHTARTGVSLAREKSKARPDSKRVAELTSDAQGCRVALAGLKHFNALKHTRSTASFLEKSAVFRG
jgi:hypothetical protein